MTTAADPARISSSGPHPARRGPAPEPDRIPDQVFPAERATPLVTVLDGGTRTPWPSSARSGTLPVTTLGVTAFGQSGDLHDVCRHHGIDTDSIITTALYPID